MWIDLSKISNLHNAYLSSLGRAVAVGQHLEVTLKFILNIAELVVETKNENVWEQLEEIHNKAWRKMVGKSIERLKELRMLQDLEFEILIRGKDARNYFAHEAGLVVSEFPERPDEIAHRIKIFEQYLVQLIEADNLVASWSYSIQEKEAPPSHIGEKYKKSIFLWVMTPIKNFLKK